ncbi:MAG: glycosyltransferase [Spirochaetales bacterium]|nr:glycosyltransferase [Spirochaetales bacterium]
MAGTYIVLSATSPGGTQNRFIALWDYCQSRNVPGLRLVVTRTLYDALAPVPNLPHFTRRHPNLIVLDAGRFLEMIVPLFFIALRAGRGAVFHYPLASLRFFHTLFGQKVVRSIPMSDLSMLLADRFKTLIYYQLLRAHRIDVLNPRVVAQLGRHWLLGRLNPEKIRLTEGNAIRVPTVLDVSGKKNWIVFLGRFTDQANDVKNVIPYVMCLPFIHDFLNQNRVNDARFFILGFGPLESRVRSLLGGAEYARIPIECYFEPHPEKVLRSSKVIMSLQKFTNYPSRSLLEAMACGNLPVITDVGESRRLADDDFAEFVPESFSAENLARAVLRLIAISKREYQQKVDAMLSHLKKGFSMETHLAYYLNFYNRKSTHDDQPTS